MSAEIESSYELDDIDEDEEELRSPLILDQGQNLNTSKCSTFSKFLPPSPRSIIKPPKPHTSPKQSMFLTVPGYTDPLPSSIHPTSTPVPVHKVSFYGQPDSLPAAEQSVSYPPRTQFDTTKYKRSQYLSNLLLILTDGLLPLVSIVSTLINVLELFLTGEYVLGFSGLVIFAFPTALVLFFYLENMFHREKKLLEIGLIILFGPFLRWLCSVRLLSVKLRPSGDDVADLDDIQIFAFATKVIDGIFEASVQIIWLLYLIAIEVYPFPLLNMRTKSVTDWFGNNLQIPVFSSLSLYSSLAVLIKNLTQLWRIHYPVSTNKNGSETLALQPKMEGSMKTLSQWLILVLFTSTGVLYRLMSYTILFLHLNLFMMPAGGIIIFSTLLHVVLRGVSNRFYVETSKMDVFLTACCCCLVPTPTSSNIRAHNLLQAHTVITNILLLISLGVCVFFSIDYSVPIVKRPSRLVYSSNYFYNYCLLAISLLPISTLFYLLYKKTMGYPGLVRRTIFWKNRKPTVVAILTGTVSLILLTSLTLLNMLGRHSSHQCQENTSPVHHGLLLPQDTGHGSRLECHQNYRPHPAASIYCSWFFGQQGVMEIVPLYYHDLINVRPPSEPLFQKEQFAVSEKVAFVRNLTMVSCVKNNMTNPYCQSSTAMCNVISLLSTAVPHGSWHCAGHSCALFCQSGYLSTGAPLLCTPDQPVPLQYCYPASLAASNMTNMETVSPDGDCSSKWERKGSRLELALPDPLFLCRNVSDTLVPGACQAADLEDHHLSFTATYQVIPRRLHVSYPPLLLAVQEKGGRTLSGEHLTVSLEKECTVKISHDTVLIVGEMTLLVRYTGPGTQMSYWVLPSLLFPRNYHACTLLDGGRLLVTGGVGVWRGNWLVESEMIDLGSANLDLPSVMLDLGSVVPVWRMVGSLAVPRVNGTILTVSGGCPLLVGGQGEQGQEDLPVEEFHLHSDKEDGDWLELSLNISFIPEHWSVALCGVDSCTGQRFSVGGQGMHLAMDMELSNEKLVAVEAENSKEVTYKGNQLPSRSENIGFTISEPSGNLTSSSSSLDVFTPRTSTGTFTFANKKENSKPNTTLKMIFSITEPPGNLTSLSTDAFLTTTSTAPFMFKNIRAESIQPNTTHQMFFTDAETSSKFSIPFPSTSLSQDVFSPTASTETYIFSNKKENLRHANTTTRFLFAVESATNPTSSSLPTWLSTREDSRQPSTTRMVFKDSTTSIVPPSLIKSMTSSTVTDTNLSSTKSRASSSVKAAPSSTKSPEASMPPKIMSAIQYPTQVAITEVSTFYEGTISTESPSNQSRQATDLATDSFVFTLHSVVDESVTSDSVAERTDEGTFKFDVHPATTSKDEEIDLTIFDLPPNYQDY